MKKTTHLVLKFSQILSWYSSPQILSPVFLLKKRWPLSMIIFCLLLTACTGTLQQQRQSYLEWMMPPPVILQKNSSTIIVQSENGNILVLIGKDHLFVVNTMIENTLWNALRKYTEKTVSHLILTGSYWEHADGLKTLTTPIEVFLSQPAYDALQSDTPSLWKAIRHHHFHIIKQKTQLFFEKRRLALYPFNTTQSEGNMALYLPDEGMLYTGMLFVEKEHAFFATRQGNLKGWIEVLHQLEKLNPKMIIPGRGNISEKREMELFRNYLEIVLQHTAEAISNKLSVEDTIQQSNHPFIDQRETIPFLANKHQFLRSVYQQLQASPKE